MEIVEIVDLNTSVKIGDTIVGQASANISSSRNYESRYSESINNYDLYTENIEECRRQFDAFKKRVREREDNLIEIYAPKEEPIEEPEIPEGEAPEEPVVEEE